MLLLNMLYLFIYLKKHFIPYYNTIMSEITVRKPTKKPATQPYKRKDQRYRRKKAVKAKYVRRPMNQQIQYAMPQIQDCTKHFIRALYDPFTTPAGVCIPCDLFPLPSQKSKAVIRGSFNLGTTGFGYVAFTPSVCNDVISLIATSNVSVGGAATGFNAFTALGNTYFTKLPYTNNDIVVNKTVSARIVACGVRIRYAGKETDRRGIYNALESGEHEDLYFSNFNSVNSDFAQTTVSRPTGTSDWDATVCNSGPVQPGELEFSNIALPLGPNSSGVTTPFIIACSGNAGDQLELEAVIHVEYIGKAVDSKTPSHSDSAGYGRAIQVSKADAAQSAHAPEQGPSAWNKFTQMVMEDAPKLIGLGRGIAQSLSSGSPFPALMAAGANIMSSGQGRYLPAAQSVKMIGYH